MPRLPRETKVDVAKCLACHAKLGGVTGDQARPSGAPEPAQCHISTTPATQNGCRQVPHLPRKTKVDVTKCHACHARRRWMSPSATPATQSWAASPATKRAQARHQSQPSAISATRATQNEGGCRQVPRLPRKTKVARETKVDVAKCHACHAKLGGVTGDQARPSAPPEPAQCHKCHAGHAKRRWMSPSATLVTRDEGGCRQVPRLLRKVGRRHRRPSAPKRATRASPAP